MTNFEAMCKSKPMNMICTSRSQQLISEPCKRGKVTEVKQRQKEKFVNWIMKRDWESKTMLVLLNGQLVILWEWEWWYACSSFSCPGAMKKPSQEGQNHWWSFILICFVSRFQDILRVFWTNAQRCCILQDWICLQPLLCSYVKKSTCCIHFPLPHFAFALRPSHTKLYCFS